MKNIKNPSVEEVRQARMELSASFGHDIGKICAFLRKEEHKHLNRLADSNPLHPAKKTLKQSHCKKAVAITHSRP